MAELPLEKAPQKVRDLFNRGFASLERGAFDYAMDIFMVCLESCPDLLRARRFLRVAEIRKMKKGKSSSFSRTLSSVTGLPTQMRASTLIKGGKYAQALVLCEKLLRQDVLNLTFARLFVDAALGSQMPEAAIMTMEMIREFYPEDVEVIARLGELYQKTGRMSSARECFEKLCELCPNDPSALKRMKDAMALDSMSSDGWEAASQGGTFKDVLKDREHSQRLEQEEKAVKTEKDADDLINDTLRKIEADPKNVNYYRALARLYAQKHDFESARETVEKAVAMNPGDPELDHILSRITVDRYDYDIARLREGGRDDEANALFAEREQYVLDDLQDRVQKYPNDLDIRYELGSVLLKYDYTDQAIQQFQRSLRSLKFRIKSLYNLALCFKQKGQYDMAKEQLDTALSESYGMDDMKKNILYELGTIAELLGDGATATSFYKQIYQSDIQFRDVAQKIERAYRSGGPASAE